MDKFLTFLESLRDSSNDDTIDAVKSGVDCIFNGVDEWYNVAEELNAFHDDPTNYSIERHQKKLHPWQSLDKHVDRFSQYNDEMDVLEI